MEELAEAIDPAAVERIMAATRIKCSWRMRLARAEMLARSEEVEAARCEFETDWVFLSEAGWREDLVFTVLRHRTLGTVIELGHSQGRSFLFKVRTSGDTPTSTPGNTPRHPDKVKMCREDAYFADWR
jgi:hypothetical protein